MTWDVGGMPVRASGSTAVMVTPPENAAHSAAALKVLAEPDALLTLVLGGDHLTSGVDAIKAAVEDKVLRPHFAVVEAKRVGSRFGARGAALEKAFELIDEDTVMSGAEIKKIAGLVQHTKKEVRKQGSVKSVVSTLGKKVGEILTDEAVVNIVKEL